MAVLDYHARLATQRGGPYFMHEGSDAEYVDFMRSMRVAIGNVAGRLGVTERLPAYGIGA
jgi:hypothetical protein